MARRLFYVLGRGRRWTRGVVAAALVALAVGVPSALALTFTGSITTSDPTQTGRLFRDGVASTCAVPKANPGTVSGSFHYDEYEFFNGSGSSQCVTVSYKATSGPCSVFVPAYHGSFNPADPAANYLADGGSSSVLPELGNTVTYSFNVASGGHFVIVAHEVLRTTCPGYQFDVNGTGIIPGDPSHAIADLRELVASLSIHHGIANALDSKLRAALAALEMGDTAGACDSLQAFLNQVAAQNGKKLTQARAQQLTNSATAIRALLDC